MPSFTRRAVFPLALSLLLTGLFVGCDSSDPGDPMGANSINGTWRGELVSHNQLGEEETFQVEITLIESRTEVSGDGTVTGSDGVLSFDVVEGGSYVHPLLNLDLLFDGPPLGQLSGNVSEDRREIHASMTGPGFSTGSFLLQIVLTRIAP
jgi:hypothetical protein